MSLATKPVAKALRGMSYVVVVLQMLAAGGADASSEARCHAKHANADAKPQDVC